MDNQNTAKSSSDKTSKVANGQNFMTNLEQLHDEASKMQVDLQQAAQEKIQAANGAYQKLFEKEQKSLSDFMAKAQENATDSGKDRQEAYFKANESFSKNVAAAQESFQNAYAKINEDFSKKFQSKHEGLLKNYIKIYREYNTGMMDAILKSVEANNPSEVINACQAMITVSQDALVKGVHLVQ